MPVETRRSTVTAAVLEEDAEPAVSVTPAVSSTSASTETIRTTRQSTAAANSKWLQQVFPHEAFDNAEDAEKRPANHCSHPEYPRLKDIARDWHRKYDIKWPTLYTLDWRVFDDVDEQREELLVNELRQAQLEGFEDPGYYPASDESAEALEEPALSSGDPRDDEELEAIRNEIAELESEIDISKQYKIVDRLGEGTFSSVYKAIDCKHAFYDNSRWCQNRPSLSIKQALAAQASLSSNNSSSNESISSVSSNASTSTSASSLSLVGALKNKHKRSSSTSSSNSPYAKLMTARKLLKNVSEEDSKENSRSKVYVALKRIYVTSSPQRIWNELDILGLLRNARHTAYLISAIRHEDQVIAVMPYEKHQDFRSYYRNMALWQMQAYFRCLFAALADCHDIGIMHRDVKPANFLFNIETNVGTLCDFGLAQRYHPSEWQGRCLHSQPLLWADQFQDYYPLNKSAIVHGEKLARPIDTLDQLQDQKAKYDELFWTEKDCLNDFSKKGPSYATDGYTTCFVPNARFERELKRKTEKDQWAERWHPVRRPSSSAKVGYMKPEFDKRPAIRANRAGTRGFRAPEVVLKCPDQTMALDIWSVGVTLLCILTRRFPFFTSTDDTEALVEIAAIFGKKRMEKCAALHNRSFITNLPCIEEPVHASLHDLVRSLNPNIFVEAMPAWARERYSPQEQHDMLNDPKYIAEEMDISFWYNSDCQLYQAIELMRSCLALDLTKRITAEDALEHPFLRTKNREAGIMFTEVQ